MRLNKRLSDLETAQPNSGLSRDECLWLVSLLARRDSLFWPWRFQMNSSVPYAEIYRRQREYLDGSVGLRAKADGKSNWKQAHHMRQKLISGGYISANHSGGQVTNVFITSLGESTSRALVGDRLKTVGDFMVRVVHELLRRRNKATREGVLFQRQLAGCPNDWDDLTELVLPLLVAGCVRCDSDTRGVACYTVTSVAIPELVTVDGIDSSMDFDDAYIIAFNAERSVLEQVEPRDPHEIVIPFPATGWGWESHEQIETK
jgi:hypothetical protein